MKIKLFIRSLWIEISYIEFVNRTIRRFRLFIFSFKFFRKWLLVKGELICLLDNIESTIADDIMSAEEMIRSLRQLILMHKVNLRWLVGTMEREELEDIYRRGTGYRPEQPERIMTILKFVRRV